MSQLSIRPLLGTPTIDVRDVHCDGACRHRSAEECATSTYLVFPYRGIFMRHLGGDDAVAEANQVLMFNADEGYSISHPVGGGDASLSLALQDSLLWEMAPDAHLDRSGGRAFRRQRLRIDARTQALVALLLHSLRSGKAEPLEAETMALTLVRRALGERTSHAVAAGNGKQRLVDRAKMLLSSDPSRRWTLAEIAAAVGGSPVYLTQLFREVEGMPLYKYQTQLRLARALDLIGAYDDLAMLGLELGFSSHSHFSTAFLKAYGMSPSAFRQSAGIRAAR